MKTTVQRMKKRIVAFATALLMALVSALGPVCVSADGGADGSAIQMADAEASIADKTPQENTSQESGADETSSGGENAKEDNAGDNSSGGESSKEDNVGESSSSGSSSGGESNKEDNTGESSSSGSSSGGESSKEDNTGESSSGEASSDGETSDEALEIMPLAADELPITTAEQFIAAVAVADSKIRLESDITLPAGSDFTMDQGAGLLLNGNGHKIIVPTAAKKLIIKSNNVQIFNITIEGDSSPVLQVWNKNTVFFEDLTVQSRTARGTGIQIGGGATVSLSGDIVTRNFTGFGFQVQNASTLDVSGLVSHQHAAASTGTVQAIQLVGTGNVLTDPENYYGTGVPAGQNTNYAFPAGSVGNVKSITSYADLNTYKATSNVVLDLQNDLTISADIDLSGQNMVVKGNGHTINNTGSYKISLKGQIKSASDLNFMGTGTGQGLQIYGASNVLLENVSFQNCAQGLLISSNNPGTAAVTLKGSLKTSQNTKAGIEVSDRGTYSLDMSGVTSWESAEDKVSLLDSANGTTTLTMPAAIYYTETDKGTTAEYTVGAQLVTDQATLEAAIIHNNSSITLEENIPISGVVTFASNVNLDGNGKTITLDPGAKLVFQQTHTVKNLTVSGPSAGEAVEITGSADVTMRDVSINGTAAARATLPQYGVVVSGGAKAAFEGTLQTSNHSTTFLVKGSSLLNLFGVTGHTSTNETNAVVLAGQADTAGNKLIHPAAPQYNTAPAVSGKDHVYAYTSSGNVKYIYTYDDLAACSTNTDVVLELQNDLILGGSIAFGGKNVVIHGNGHIIDSNGTNSKITLQGLTQELHDLTFRNFTGQGLLVYGGAVSGGKRSATVENVSFIAGTGGGTIGLLANNGAVLTLKGAVSTSGHKTAGIQRNSGTANTVDMSGVTSWKSTEDAVSLLDLTDGTSGLTMPTSPSITYTKTVVGTTAKYTVGNELILSQETLEAAIAKGDGTIKLSGDFSVNKALTFSDKINLDGNGKTITLGPDAKLIFTNTHTITGLTLNGTSQKEILEVTGSGAIVTMKNAVINATLLTRTTQPPYGVHIGGGAKAAFEGTLTTSNHISSFLVKGGSTLDLSGVTSYTSANETNAAVLAGQAEGAANILKNPVKPPYGTVPVVSGKDHLYVYSASGNVRYITSYDDLDAVQKETIDALVLEFLNDITLKGDISLKRPNTVVHGNGHTVENGEEGKKITLQGQNQSLSGLTFTGYGAAFAGLQLYGANSFALENVTFTAAEPNTGAVGLLVNGSAGQTGANVTIRGTFSTANHKGAGIRMTGTAPSAVTIVSDANYKSENDVVALQAQNADNKTVTVNLTPSPFVDAITTGTTKNFYTSFYEIVDYVTLKGAANVGNAGRTVKITKDFTFPTDADTDIIFSKDMRGITIDGGGSTITLANDKNIELRGDQTFKNLTVKGHTKRQALTVYGADAKALVENVTLQGETTALTGMHIGSGATVTLKNVTTTGHVGQGLRVTQASKLILQEPIVAEGDGRSLVSVHNSGGVDDNTIQFPDPAADPPYAPYHSKTVGTAETVYQMFVTRKVKTAEELLAALLLPNANITMENDITLPAPTTDPAADITIDKRGIVLNGGGFKLDTGSVSLLLKEQAKLQNLTVTGYKAGKPGIWAYGTKADVTLTDVTLLGDNSATQTGLDVSNGAKVTVSGTLATDGHLQQGIRVRVGSALLLADSTVESIRDVASMNVITVDGETENTVTFPRGFYEGPFKTADKNSAGKDRVTDAYIHFNPMTVKNEQELLEAIALKNVTIILGADVSIDPESKYPATGEETGEILFPGYAKLDGAGHTIQLQNDKRPSGAKQVRLAFKGKYADVQNLTVTGYISNGLTVYRVPQAVLDTITMKGISEKSTTGLVIQGSTVELKNISTSNHTARGVQITGQTTSGVTLPAQVAVSGKWSSVNDKITVKLILQPTDTRESILTDPEKLFFTSGKTRENGDTGYTYAWNYYLIGQTESGSITTQEALVKALTTPGSKIELESDLLFDGPKSAWLDSDKKQTLLEIAPGVQLLGNGHKIDLKSRTGFIIKSGDVSFRDVTILNAKQDGVTAYNSRNVTLTNVALESCGRWGLMLNGSEVVVHDLSTKKNGAGGIQLSRSRTLRAASSADSRLIVKGNIKHQEYGFDIQVKNVELLTSRRASDGTLAKYPDGSLQDPISKPSRWTENTITRGEGEDDTIAELYTVHEEPIKYNKLSSYYTDLFDFEEEDDPYNEEENKRDPNTLYGEQEINYMAAPHKLNVKRQDLLKDGNTPVQLLGSDAEDPKAEKRKLQRLVSFAATNGYLLYFPADTYTLCGDLNLTRLNGLPSLSNFGFVGDSDVPSILRACHGTPDCDCALAGMLRIGSFNAGDGEKDYYKYPVYYMRVENMVFDNVGIAMDSSYKRGLEVVNNVFLNGGYKGPYPKTKTIAGEEIVGTEVELFPYVTANSIRSTITGNIFLRTKDHAGKGISVYRSKESLISSNIFGNPQNLSENSNLFRVPGALMRLEMLREFEEELGLDLSEETGNFFTCINAVGYDENLEIQSNYFHVEPTKNVTISNKGAPASIHFIQGLNETLRENWQRRDHLIYGKSYQNIYVENNYFYGQENGGAGGVKLRNGKGIYVASNYMHNVPLLIYVYNDLGAAGGSNVLSDAIIYNNTFQTNTNFGKPHAGILYYQSFQNTRREYADIRNFVLYNNRFLSDYRDNITISQNVLIGQVDRSKEFYGYGNVYSCGAVNVPEAADLAVPIPWNILGRTKINAGDRVKNGSIGWQEVSEKKILEQIEKSSIADHFFQTDGEFADWKDTVPAIVPRVDYGYFDLVLATAAGKVPADIISQARDFRKNGQKNTQAECNLWATYLISNGADEILPPVSGMGSEPDPVELMPDKEALTDTRFDDAEQTKDLEDKS